MTELSGWNRILVVAAMAVLVLLFYLSAAAHFDYTTDDSYIYFQYAKNLSQGDGPSFNAGTPGYGFTGPLWLLIISAGGAAGADIPLTAKILDLLFASLSIVILFFLALELTRDMAVAFCASLAFSVNAWMLRWAGSGLETSLAVLLMLAFFRYLLRNEYPFSAGALGLLTLVRPEAVLLLVPLLLDVRINTFERSVALRTGTRVISVWLIIVLPWWFFAYALFGSIIPTTFGAKHAALFEPGEMAGAFMDVVKTLGSADAVSILCLLAALLLFAGKYRKEKRAGGAGPGSEKLPLPLYHFRQSLVAISWIVLLPLFYTLFSVNVVSRYLLLVTPLILVLAYFYLHELLLKRSPATRYGIVLALTGLIMVQNQVVYKKYAAPHIAAFTEGVELCLRPIGTWLRENTPPGTVVLTADVGAVGYYSERVICDYNGIVSPGAASSPKNNTGFTGLLGSGDWKEFCAPAYVVHRGDAPEELGDLPGLVPVLSRPFSGLSISEPRTVYFTLYRVDYTAPEKLTTRR